MNHSASLAVLLAALSATVLPSAARADAASAKPADEATPRKASSQAAERRRDWRYDIMHTPFRRDVAAELAKACHEAGRGLGRYFSPMDRRDPGFHPSGMSAGPGRRRRPSR